MLFRARRAAGKKGSVSSRRSASGPPPGAAKRSASAGTASGPAQGKRHATASPCKRAARTETVSAAVRWQVSHLGERVGEAAHPGPAPGSRAGAAHLAQEAGPPAAAQQLLPIYVDFGGETHSVEVAHLATVGELAALVPGQGEMGVAIYFGGKLLDNMTALADAGIGAEARVEARVGVRIFAAGSNDYCQLGIPTAEASSCLSPVAADGLQPPQGAEIAELHCGANFVVLRTAQGDVLHAGANNGGQRGEGSTDYDSHPQLSRVPLPAAAVNIAVGVGHAAAALADRSVHTWGDNTYRQLGRGGDEAVPQAVPGISDAERLSAGACCTFAHRRGGEVSAWGSNFAGQLCLGRAGGDEDTPQRVAALCGVPLLHLSGGVHHCIALRADGHALAWGTFNGRLADGSADWTPERGGLPIVLQIGPQLSVAAGFEFCGSVGRDGVLRLWGRGHAQQPAAAPLPGGAAAREVVCGYSTVFARSAGGEWAAMGSGNLGLPFGSVAAVQELRPLPEDLAGCRRVVTGPSSDFALYLCAQ